MIKNNILNSKQQKFLQIFSENKEFSEKFYLGGGTALCVFYIPYRYSEDLDFFAKKEIDTEEILTFLKSQKEKLGFRKLEFNTSFNRNLFFLKFSGLKLKLEFTFYPFEQIHQPKKIKNILVDSVEDIASNKLFTIYQKPRSRDFIDLYMICQNFGFSINRLVKNAKIKFDTHIDPLKLGSQFLLATQLKDFPRLIVPLKEKNWQDFFLNEAQNLKDQIIE